MVYEARPIICILELWEGCLREAMSKRDAVQSQIETLSSCIEGLKRNLKATPRPISAAELEEMGMTPAELDAGD